MQPLNGVVINVHDFISKQVAILTGDNQVAKKQVYMVIMVLGFFFLIWLLHSFQFCATCFCVLYPLYKTLGVLVATDRPISNEVFYQWLTYWVAFACWSVIEGWITSLSQSFIWNASKMMICYACCYPNSVAYVDMCRLVQVLYPYLSNFIAQFDVIDTKESVSARADPKKVL